MTTFYFAVNDLDEKVDVDLPFDFNDLSAAIDYAREILSDMALDGIPAASGARKSVIVLGPDKVPIAAVSLRLSVDYVGSARGKADANE